MSEATAVASWLSEAALDELVNAVTSRIELPKCEPDPWLDTDAAAAYLACDPRRIYDLVAMGRLRQAKDGRRLLFRREWLDAALDFDT